MCRVNPTFTTDYSNEGGPLIIGPRSSVVAWRGVADYGAGYRVSYVSRVGKLPAELRRTRRAGMQVREVATNAEATAFEQRVLTVLRELHPAAEVRSDRGQHIGDQGDERVFSVETSHRSMYEVLSDELPGDDAQILTLEGVRALFLDDQPGTGSIRADERTGAVLRCRHRPAHRRLPGAPSPRRGVGRVLRLLPS